MVEKEKGISLNRALVLTSIDKNEPIAIHELQEKLKIPRTTLIHHLEQLKKRGLIIEKTSKDIKDKKEIGSPVYLTTNKANPIYEPLLLASGAIIDFLGR